ncbi:hypothetical protein IVB34_47535 [Bradyrhizobium sp. 2]|uniref:hypothetical protein n=1 Tax=unclassified Bradyrhizobium TaxID=2631580 RepID=UPI001FFAEA00|nr:MULTISPECIES: hypothetical protein [unclassified Bradyrhizobium]MCK1465745.1 hypothetical protein [Bradyrhizobium sp. 2]MCK1520192.1 hypothetical protein [Bradyrhizobium sp. 17]
MSRDTFEHFIRQLRPIKVCYIDPGEPDKLFGRAPDVKKGWAVFCGFDERGYSVIVQKAANDRQVMVRAGCQWRTLKAARTHWVSAARNYNAYSRRTAKQILMLIDIGVRRARDHGWTKETFNAAPRKATR